MLKWLGKVMGGGNESGFAAQVKGLYAHAVRDTGLRAGMADDAAAFVDTGEPSQILHEVSTLAKLPEGLGFKGYQSKAYKDLGALYSALDQAAPEAGLRYAQLLEASLASMSTNWSYQLPSGLRWPEVLVTHVTGHRIDSWTNRVPSSPLTHDAIERILEAQGHAAHTLVVSAFASPCDAHWGAAQRLAYVKALGGFPQALERHAAQLAPLLAQGNVDQRLHMLDLLEKATPAALTQLAEPLCELATASSGKVRQAAAALVQHIQADAVAPLQVLAENGKPDQRLAALRLIWQFGQDANRSEWVEWAQKTAAADKAPSVQALPTEWTSAASAATESLPTAYDYAVPTLDLDSTLTLSLSTLLDQVWVQVNAVIEKSNEQSRRHHEEAQKQGHKWALHQTPLLTSSQLRAAKAAVTSNNFEKPSEKRELPGAWANSDLIIGALVAHEGMTPVTAIRLMIALNLALAWQGQLSWPMIKMINTLHDRAGGPQLLEWSLLLERFGWTVEQIFGSYSGQLARHWPDGHVWPFFVANLDTLIELLKSNRAMVFRALQTLPAPPPPMVPVLFDLALGTSKLDRPAAQAALSQLVAKEPRIITALSDGKSETRAVAARWLGDLRHAPAVPALEQAVVKEKNDVAKGAMLDALEVLGQPVDRYLDRAGLADAARKSLAKDKPKDLDWFPFGSLPRVRWSDTEAEIPADVLQWFIVQAAKAKSAEPNAVLRKYCGLMEARDREAFGQFVLEAWLREDVRPIDQAEALKRATQEAQSSFASMKQYPQYAPKELVGKSVEELLALNLPRHLRQPAGSAIGSKGVLAVAAACAAERVAPVVSRYLKEWYGTRAAQGKALIGMLGWIDHASATQLMLSIGSRFRTKSFQQEATAQAEALAERKGWTMAELADRTIPTAGFDEDGVLELSYGLRQFAARLLEDFKIELQNPEGKKIAALPEPRQDDDAEAAKEAKKALSSAKKEIKSIVDLQTGNLYEALCTQRTWRFEDWNVYLNRHPVMRKLTQRLVWSTAPAESAATPPVTFRPLDDGTLTDASDEAVELASDTPIRVAHESTLASDASKKWLQHLADYEVKPLFQQFGKGVYHLPADKAGAEELKDFEGHLVETFALRGRANKLGYQRGPTGDGGWFSTYEKRFTSLGVEAIVEFTGNPLPEESRTAALLSLSFQPLGSDPYSRQALRLSRIPAVLLSECYNDCRLMAAEGPGFDPEWAKKSSY